MAISDFFNPVKAVKNLSGKISDYFGPVHYVRQEEPVAPVKRVPKEKIIDSIHYFESTRGTHPNTPKDTLRSYTIPAANQNEKPRTVKYQSGFAGDYGITPSALAQLAKSQIDRNASTTAYTKYGAPLIPGMSTDEIQRMLKTREGAGRLAEMYFNTKRAKPDDYSPEALADDYMERYVGQGSPNYTPENRQRVLEYFMSLAI